MFHGNGLVVMTVSQGQGGISREKGDKNNLGCLGRARRAPRAQVPTCSQSGNFSLFPLFLLKPTFISHIYNFYCKFCWFQQQDRHPGLQKVPFSVLGSEISFLSGVSE